MTQVLTSIANNLTDTGFKVSRNVLLSDGKTAELAASRTSFSWKGFVILSQHIIVRYIDRATHQDMKTLFESGFRFGKKANRIPLLRGMQFGYLIIPVILTDNADRTLIESAAQRPAKHWALSEFPLVIDLASHHLAYFQGFVAWGALYLPDLKEIVKVFTNGIQPRQSDQQAPSTQS